MPAAQVDDCIFCRIAKGDIPATKVAENDHALAFRDVNPQAPVHILVIPKVHIVSMAETDDPTLLGALLHLAVQVAKAEGLAEQGYRTVINTGQNGGQTVYHLHAHILGGRHMTWPPG
jgi:histidine triad (HIT) family protein